MSNHKDAAGHLAAFLTIFIWGTTFISTKVLLSDFQPVEILFFRFVLGFAALCLAYPRRMKVTQKKQEITFILAGLCGICLYYLLENIALTYTMASNVGVIISISPFFTAIFTRIVSREKGVLKGSFFLGFATAMAGICLISFQGSGLHVNPMGDILAVLAAIVWALYSILSRKISGYGYPVIQSTRRTFFWGLLFMVPAMFFFEFHIDMTRFANPVYLANILFLGLGASALCFVTWNVAVKKLGAVRTSVYIYLVPVITVVTSVLVLKEKITLVSAAGIALTLAGLFISERKNSL